MSAETDALCLQGQLLSVIATATMLHGNADPVWLVLLRLFKEKL